MKWSRLTIALFVLSMTFMVLAGFMLLMLLGTSPGEPGHGFARVAFPVCVLGFLASGAGAWLDHRRRRNLG